MSLLQKCVKFKINWKIFLEKMNLGFAKYQGTPIGQKVLDSFKRHLNLEDLWKICFKQENEDFNQFIKNNDSNLRLTQAYNFYSKYITADNVIFHPEKKDKIPIFKANLLFEDCLINI